MEPKTKYDARYFAINSATLYDQLTFAKTGPTPQIRDHIAASLGLPTADLSMDLLEKAHRLAVRAVDATISPDNLSSRGYLIYSRFLSALSSALVDGGDLVPPPRHRAFEWVKDGLTPSVVEAFVKEVMPKEVREETSLSTLKYLGGSVRFRLSAQQSRALSLRIRDVNSAVFTEPVLEIAERLAKARSLPLAELPRVGTSPTTKVSYGKVELDGIVSPKGTSSSGPFDAGLPSPQQFGPQRTPYSNRAGVGDYGERLAESIVEAVRIAMGQVSDVAARLEASEPFAAAKNLVLQPQAVDVLQEGIVSIGHVLSMMLGQGVPGMSADEVLAKIGDGALVTQLAMTAPFGVLGPHGNAGLLAQDPITFTDEGRAVLPRSLHDLVKTAHQKAEIVSAESNTHTMPKHRTETLTGCPVAVRGPIRREDGSVEMTAQPALQSLAVEVIALVRRVLQEKSAAT